MKWTKEQPHATGWYWFRTEHGVVVGVVQVKDGYVNEWTWGHNNPITKLSWRRGQWCRVPEPTD